MDDIKRRIDELPASRRALLEKLLQEKRQQQAPALVAHPPEDSCPLSFEQERLWFLEQLQPGRRDYLVPAALELKGLPDRDALEKSLNLLVARHETLRSAFVTGEGLPRLKIEREISLTINYLELDDLPPAQREAAAQHLLEKEATTAFDLTRAPLLRVSLVKLDHQRYRLVLMAHHLICDGWSVRLFTEELAACYNAYREGRAPELAPLPVQFHDYVPWEREWLRGERLEKLEDYWKEVFSTPAPDLNLPYDYPRPAAPTLESEKFQFHLPLELLEKLAELARQKNCTTFGLLYAAYAVLLQRYTGQSDIVVATPVMNRPRRELFNLVGFFANTVLLRLNLTGRESFEEALEKARTVTLGAFDHQELPFARLVNLINPERSAYYTPIARVALTYQHDLLRPPGLNGLETTLLQPDSGVTPLDFSLVLQEEETGLAGVITYMRELFEAETVRRFAGNFKALLEAISANPAIGLTDLPVDTTRLSVTSSLSSNQALVWAGQQLQPDLPLYNEAMLFTIEENLDPSGFKEAFRQVVLACDALRSKVLSAGGVPRLVTNHEPPFELEFLDLSASSATLTELQKIITLRQRAFFELENGLYRSLLVKLSENRFAWYLCLHQLIVDGWSFNLLYRQVLALYRKIRAGEEPAPPALPEYRAFIAAEQAYLASPPARTDADYWKKKLDKEYESVSFYAAPSTRPDLKVVRRPYEPGVEKSRALQEATRRKGFTAFSSDMALSNLFITLSFAYLHRVSGKSRLSLGIPFHNRNSRSARELVGLVMSVCPVRVELDSFETFAGLSARVQSEIRDTVLHSRYIIASRPENPAYRVMFNYHNSNYTGFEDSPSEVTLPHSGYEDLDFAIQVTNFQPEKGFRLYFDFNTALFDEGQQAQAIRDFMAVVEAFLDNPDTVISQIRLPGQERSLLAGANTEHPVEDVIALFMAQAHTRPAATALVAGDRRYSYAEMAEMAGKLARELKKQGIGPEKRVGLLAHRTPRIIASLPGILMTGAAYVPLDPQNPNRRLEQIIRDSGITALVGHRSLLPPALEIPPVFFDLDAPLEKSAALPPQDFSPALAAYCLYTSGTTGQPKGVLVERGSLSRYTAYARREFDLKPGDRVLQFASLAFDTAAEEIFPALTSGATLVLREDGPVEAPGLLLKSCGETGITVLDLPTAYWHVLVAEARLQKLALPPDLRLVIIGGEAAQAGYLVDWTGLAGERVRLVNSYGPTEATIVAATADLKTVPPNGEALPVGRPVSHTRLYLLNPALAPVPPGATGELYIGGDNLARGYLNLPALTAEKFRPDPFSGIPGARMYRTGDLARVGPDGQLQFQGRVDHQLKLRGFRVEPGEIEAALLSHPAVRQAALVPLPERDRTGSYRLVAWVVLREGVPASEIQLKEYLETRLPAYMLPQAIKISESLPLTVSGKIDYRALQNFAFEAGPVPEREIPAGEIEQAIAWVWAELLGLEYGTVGRRDNFFAAGGHSLLGAQLVSRLNRRFGVELPLRALFEIPTITGLAAHISRLPSESAPDIPVPRRTGKEFPLSFSQLRLWFLDQLSPGNPAYNVPFCVRIEKDLDPAALQYAVNRLVTRHEILRTTFGLKEGAPVQLIAETATVPVEVTDYSGLPEADALAGATALAEEEARRPFNLALGPLLRVKLAKISENARFLMVTMHHIVSDGWSLGIFVDELIGFYREYREGVPLSLPPLGFQYADFALWQQELAGTGAYRKQLQFWQERLAGAPPLLKLPLDFPRPPVERFQGATVSFQLDEALAGKLKTLSDREGATLHMVLMAAFQILLYRYSRQPEILVGTPVAGRNHPDTENLIGFFVNTLVFRTDFKPDNTFREVLQQVRSYALEAYANQAVAFEKVVEILRPERNLSYSPVFQVMFTFLNEPTRRLLSKHGWPVRLVEIERGMANRDLTLRMEESGPVLQGHFEYNSDLFRPETIRKAIRDLIELLTEMITDIQQKITGTENMEEPARNHRQNARQKFEQFLGGRPKTFSGENRLVRVSPRWSGDSLPLLVEPEVPDLEPENWAARHRDWILENLYETGAILFRGFNVASPAGFEKLVRAVTPELAEYQERSSPRHLVEGSVYTSTEYPADQYIMLHNEVSYSHRWPLKLWFFCQQPAEKGGATPLVDSRRVYQALDPAIRQEFAAKGVKYVRNYGNDLDLPWPEVFQTTRREEVEAYCRETGIEFEWLPDNRLRTAQVRQGVAQHPVTGAPVWFNSAHMFHLAAHTPEVKHSLLKLFGPENLPRHAYFGDGSPIEDGVIEHIRDTYRRLSVSYPWQTGDVALIDNMLVAHGREPFTGPRRVLVAMAEPYSIPEKNNEAEQRQGRV